MSKRKKPKSASPREIIRTGVFGITVTLEGDGGTITSDLRQSGDSAQILVAYDVLESLILAHACAGIDIQDPAYLEGIETAVEAVSHHLGEAASKTDEGKATDGQDRLELWGWPASYVLYDYGTAKLATLDVYDEYNDAVEDASQSDGLAVLALALFCPAVQAGTADENVQAGHAEPKAVPVAAATKVVTKYVLYDFDADDLASTTVYDDPSAAAEDAARMNNVMVVTLSITTVTCGGAD